MSSGRSKIVAIEAIVKGRVQRVGYRRYLLDVAQELGVTGFVENLRDGSVRIFCQGPQEDLKRFIRRARKPPAPIKVKEFNVKEVRPGPRLRYFRIKYGPVQEELQEGFGAMQAIFMDYLNEFRDYRGEFRDYRSEFRDFRDEFRDYRSEFRSFVKEFRDYREEFREFAKRTDENFDKIMEKYGAISEKLTQILNTLMEESKKSKEMLERIEADSKETRQMLNEAMALLRQAVERLSVSRGREA